MADCPSCGGKAVLNGTRDSVRLDIRDGRLVRYPVKVAKLVCRQCRSFRSSETASVSPDLVEAVMDGMFSSGARATALALGCDRSTIETVFRNWVSIQKRTLPTRVPEVVGIHVMPGNAGAVLLTDAVERTVVGAVEGHAGLREWFAGHSGEPEVAVIDPDPRTAGAVREAFPGILVAVPSSSAIDAVRTAAVAALKAIVRKGAHMGRNFREDPALLSVPDWELSPAQANDLACWSSKARGLRRVTVDVVAALRSGTPAEARAVIDSALAILGTDIPVGALGRFLSTWREEILAGVADGMRWIDKAFLAAREVIDATADATPALRRSLCAFLLFHTPERELSRVASGLRLARARGDGLREATWQDNQDMSPVTRPYASPKGSAKS
jgi:hypothetical protein